MSKSNGSTPPPFNQEAERSVLGAVLLLPDGWDSVGATLEAGSFFQPQHRIIWQAMDDAVRAYGRADATTTLEVLRCNGKLDEVKGDYLLDLINKVPDPTNLPTYARIVRELSLRRDLLQKSTLVATAAHTGDDYRAAVEDLVREVYRADAPGLRNAITAVELLESEPERADALTEPALIVRKGISVLASDTKVGKTNLWLHAAWALTEGKPLFGVLKVPQPVPVLLIELELSEATMHKRLTFLREHLGWSKEGLGRFNLWCSRSLHLDKRGGASRLAQIIQSTVPRPEVVIVDSYNAAITGDPDNTAESRKGLNTLRDIQEQTGVSFGITCEIRKSPPGQKLKYSIHDLKGNNVVAYDADAVVMLRPTDDSRKTLSLSFPALRHCEDLPEDIELHRKGLSFEYKRKGSEGSDEIEQALRTYQEFGGDMTWKACADELRRKGLKFSNESLGPVIKKLKDAA